MSRVSKEDRAHFARIGQSLREVETAARKQAASQEPGEKILLALEWSSLLSNDVDQAPSEAELVAQGSLLLRWKQLHGDAQ